MLSSRESPRPGSASSLSVPVALGRRRGRDPRRAVVGRAAR